MLIIGDIMKNNSLEIFVETFIKYLDINYSKPIKEVFYSIKNPQPNSKNKSYFYNLFCTLFRLYEITENPIIEIYKFKEDLKNLGTFPNLVSILKDLLLAEKVILINPIPSVINITLINPSQFEKYRYVNIKDNTQQYINSNCDQDYYITKDGKSNLIFNNKKLIKFINRFLIASDVIGELNVIFNNKK